ncbi:MAG: DNA-directed RNA polymerase subunit A'', partial [Nanoarchaeota archaeon]
MKELFNDYKGKISDIALDEIEELANSRSMNKTQVKKVLELAYEEYKNSMIEPGECVGLISAQSVGEP